MKQMIGHLLSLLVGGYFLWAGVVKVLDPAKFFQDILNYQLIGEELAWLVALYLPWLEIVAALALFWPRTRLAALCWIADMLLVFIAALISALVRGLDIECGCLGSGGGGVVVSLVIDLVLLAAVAGIAIFARSAHSGRS